MDYSDTLVMYLFRLTLKPSGGSGAGGGDHRPSGEKGTTRVGRRSKKPSAFHRAALRYL